MGQEEDEAVIQLLAAFAKVAAERGFGERVYANQPQRLAAQGRRGDVPLDHRRGRPETGLHADAAVDFFIQAGRPADDAVGGFTGDGVGGQLKGAAGGTIRQVNGDHHRHANGHAENEKNVLQRPSPNPPRRHPPQRAAVNG